MNDLIEKVKQGLKHCSDRSRCNDRCPYSNIIKDQNEGMDSCVTQLAADAMSVIKEQQAEIERLKAQPTVIKTDHFEYVFPQKDGEPDG